MRLQYPQAGGRNRRDRESTTIMGVSMPRTRRQFIRDLGLSAAALPFVLNLPGLAFANQQKRKQRIIFMFSPNGVVRKDFWPDKEGAEFELKEILSPLKPYQDQLLLLNGLCDKVRGDGDSH